jgi:hypothetical protein
MTISDNLKLNRDQVSGLLDLYWGGVLVLKNKKPEGRG